MIQKNIVQPAAQRAARKLRSQKGASITFALFLFLVCAVIGSVVLTAGTTSSGRISQMAEMDQRYYAVTSACEFLKTQIKDQKVTIVRKNIQEITTTVNGQLDETTGQPVYTTTKTNKWTYETDLSMSPNPNKVEVETEGDVIPKSETGELTGVSAGANSFLSALAVKLMFGENNCNTDAALTYTFKNGHAQSGVFNFDCELNSSGTTGVADMDAMEVSGSYKLRDDGSLVFAVQSDFGSGSSHQYALELTMKGDIDETSETTTNTEKKNRTYTESGWVDETVETTTILETSTIKWTFGGIRKV